MAENWYRETEKLIASYWYYKDRIARLEAVEKAILDSLSTLTQELAAANSVPSYVAKYGIRPPAAPGQNKDLSDLMADIEEQVDKLAAEIVGKLKRLASIRTRLQRARETIAPIEVVMARLSEDEKRITELRYVYRRSYYAIAEELPFTYSGVRRAHRRVIYLIATWLGNRPKTEVTKQLRG